MSPSVPRMDGLTFLGKLTAQHPFPLIICSSLGEEGCESAMRALEQGAVDIIQKPKMGTRLFLTESRARISDAIKAAARSQAMLQTTERVVAVGASTGLPSMCSPARSRATQGRKQVVFLLLDSALGEYDVETRIAGIDVQPGAAAPKTALPLHDLPKAVDALK